MKFRSAHFLVLSLAFALAACTSLPEKKAYTTDTAPGSDIKNTIKSAPYADSDGTPDVVSYENYSDPLIWLNRPIFAFNNVTYRYALSPLAKGYQKIIPKPVNQGISNFFDNLKEPISLINHTLQGHPRKSGNSLARFLLNSTVGLLGFFDVSDHWWQLEKQPTGFSDTLATWGVGYGAYLVLPVLGPSDLRDGAGMLTDRFAHPVHYMEDGAEKNILVIYDGFHSRVDMLVNYPDVVKELDDPYIFIRNFYLQNTLRNEDFLSEKPSADLHSENATE